MMKNQKTTEKENIRLPEKPLKGESVLGPSSRFIWKMLAVLVVFALIIWLLKLLG